MLQRILALVTRAFRSDSRDLRSHLFRLALPALFIVTIMLIQMDRILSNAPGLELFAWLIAYNYIFITFAAATFFATAIAEEREAQTLGLLRIAGVSPLAILLGKWLPRMWTAILLLLVQFPFTLLCVTLGGIQWPQIAAAFACILAHLMLVGGIALLCSVLGTTSTRASGSATIWIIMLHLCIWLASALGWFPMRSLLVEFLGANQLFSICASGYRGQIITYQVVSNLAVGIGFMLLAWALFDVSTMREVSESRASVGQRLRHLTSGRRRRAWQGAPLIWQAFYYVAEGPVWMLVRLATYFAVAICFVLWVASWRGQIDTELVGATLLFLGAVATIAEGAYFSAVLFRQEVTDQTWGTLCMLPEHLPAIAYPRVVGALIGILPGLTCLFLSALLLPRDLFRALGEPEFCMVMFFFVGVVVWGWHLATLFSISIDWAAWPAAIFLAAVVSTMYFICTIVCAETTNGDEAVAALMGLVAWGLSLITHALIAVKLKLRMAE